jgi:cobW/hypB/ureG, nucleotide-binding domain
MFKPMQELTIEKGVETEKAKSKVYLFLGALGSGKTTLINNLSQNFPENTLVIINDV